MFKIITIPFNRNEQGFDTEILNKCLLNKLVKSYLAEFFQDGEKKYWTIFLEYDPVIKEISKPQELEELNDPQKLLFDRLKAWRREKAEGEGIPVYFISTNEELIGVGKAAPQSLEALKAVHGFGKSKIAKYGPEIFEIIKGFYQET